MENLNKMTVVVKDNGFGIKSIIIDEPKTYNSLSFKTLKMLIHTFRRLERDNKTRVIILSGNGDMKFKFKELDVLSGIVKKGIINVLDISYGGEIGVKDTIKMSKDIFSNVKLLDEIKLLEKYIN